jgi:Zn finger protein HypA/HybF involved in hydrogenase expression
MKTYIASCACGYYSRVTTGGLSESFKKESYFPFYCKSCGVVDVNVQLSGKSCPDCQSKNILEYGTPGMSLPNGDTSYVYCFNHKTPTVGNFCPRCNQMTLKFDSSGLIIG